MPRYPLGEHHFKEVRSLGCIYVDKTDFIPQLLWDSKYIFLSRPRRFGKSLFLTTLEAYFRGEKHLFQGLKIMEYEKEWKSYPVLHIDMSLSNGKDANSMNEFLHEIINSFEKQFGTEENINIQDVGNRFGILLNNIYKATNQQVVVLIDEYDKGILEVMGNPSMLHDMNSILRSFYSQIKGNGDVVKFCMITGVARFANYTLFSGPNNFTDISMIPRYASICGITQQELEDTFESGIKYIAQCNKWTIEETLDSLRQKYDNYRFTRSDTTVYNPYSILNAFNEGSLENFWIKSGVSQVFTKYLSQNEFDLLELQDLWVSRERMEDIFKQDDAIPLLFQTGYLTIKDNDGDAYLLDIPNGEVRSALVNQIIPHFTGISQKEFPKRLRILRNELLSGNIEGWINELKSIIASIPSRHFMKNIGENQSSSLARLERTYHIIVEIIFQMTSVETHSEMAVSGGSIDMVVATNKFVYVIEFKLGGTASEAIRQIEEKGYALSWSTDQRQLYKIGIVFSPSNHTISEYKIIQ